MRFRFLQEQEQEQEPRASSLSSPPPSSHRVSSPLVAATCAGVAAFSFLFVFAVCFRRISKKRTVPSPVEKPPHRFSYTALRRATESFSPSFRLGQGGFGSVYRGTLSNGQTVAIKVMDSGSLQGEREFQNELLFASKVSSPHAITAIGFSSDRKRQSMLLVYELMPNGNLQDALLHRKCLELGSWAKRFSICLDIARGIEYLHGLDPPVIHGDIKPSNVLLDESFNAKIADFGLAWLKERNNTLENAGLSREDVKVTMVEEEEKANHLLDLKRNGVERAEDSVSVVETESVMTATTTGFDEFTFGVENSPESYIRELGVGTSMENVEPVSASMHVEKAVAPVSPEGAVDGEGNGFPNNGDKNWWWKQDNSGLAENGAVKDYVREWIGSEIKKEMPKRVREVAQPSNTPLMDTNSKKKSLNPLACWQILGEGKGARVVKKRNEPREWWKEDYCEELERKKRKKKKKEELRSLSANNGEDWWPQDESLSSQKRKKRKSRSRGSHGSFDWFSGELFRGYRDGHDSLSGDITKSGGVSSTPSMRGTVCYAAPEYNGGGILSEKSDVYSFGVLLLVLIAGRRPLQVASSPLSNFLQANLMHWARHLARGGKLLDLVDQNIHSLDQDQAQRCITVALLCLQKSPSSRPTMQEVVKLLTVESEVPQLPTEFSPSPPTKFRYDKKSKKKSLDSRREKLQLNQSNLRDVEH